jgi:hypothetical protein
MSWIAVTRQQIRPRVNAFKDATTHLFRVGSRTRWDYAWSAAGWLDMRRQSIGFLRQFSGDGGIDSCLLIRLAGGRG